jgi:hypothetical protein
MVPIDIPIGSITPSNFGEFDDGTPPSQAGHGVGVLELITGMVDRCRGVIARLKVPGFRELFEAPVVCFFSLFGEAARRQLFHGQVVMEALAAHALFTAGIGAVAFFQVLGFLAVHGNRIGVEIYNVGWSKWAVPVSETGLCADLNPSPPSQAG